MKLNPKQKEAVNKVTNTTVEACPGAGKTRTLIAKLINTIEEVQGSSKKIACITYTNAAVYEIESRLVKNSNIQNLDCCDVSTIHGFCLNNILRPYSWKIAELKNGFKIATPDSDEYRDIARQVCIDHGINPTNAAHFEALNIFADGSLNVPRELSAGIARAFWERLYRAGLVDFPSLLWFSFKVLRANKNLARAISSKYKWLLIDEFQDTSDIQLEMFKIIHDVGRTKFFIVGDKNQSIFSFAGANPENFSNFSDYIKSENSTSLNENFRSSDSIVKLANSLICNDVPMISSEKKSKVEIIPEYIHTINTKETIIKYFLQRTEELSIPYSEIAILAPWWVDLLNLGRTLRENNYPITGPGARPYRRSHMIAPFLEQLCSVIASLGDNGQLFRLEREFADLILLLGGKFHITGFDRRVYLFRIIRYAKASEKKSKITADWILSVTEYLAEILNRDFNILKNYCNLIGESANAIFSDMLNNNINPGTLPLKDFALFSSNRDSIKLLTLHRSKGREFDAVAIINVNDNRIPHFSSTSQKEIEEAKRLLYVGITRARKYLLIVSDSENNRNTPSRFLSDLHKGSNLKKII